MRSKDNFVDSTKVMELAFENILDDIIEHVIEGICFEAHRAVKLGYFPVDEYIVKDSKFEIYKNETNPSPKDPEKDIFGNVEKNIALLKSACPRCNKMKATNSIIRHLKRCNSRTNGSLDYTGRTEIEDEDDSNDYDNYERKKEKDAKRQAKGALKYEDMTPDEKQDFLKKCCGVVSVKTRLPCKNSLSCRIHKDKDKDEVRGIKRVCESPPDTLVDGDIDIDTVD